MIKFQYAQLQSGPLPFGDLSSDFWSYLLVYIPGSSGFVCNICAMDFNNKPCQKGRNFTYLEDPGSSQYVYIYILEYTWL